MTLLPSIIQNSPLQTEWIWFGGTICIVLILVMLVIWILIGVWIYRDAESRGMSGAMWLIIVLFIGILGLIIYLIVREDKKTRQAPSYPQGYPPPQQPYPYAPPQAGANYCQSCGAALEPGSKFCRSCGRRI